MHCTHGAKVCLISVQHIVDRPMGPGGISMALISSYPFTLYVVHFDSPQLRHRTQILSVRNGSQETQLPATLSIQDIMNQNSNNIGIIALSLSNTCSPQHAINLQIKIFCIPRWIASANVLLL